MQHFWLFLAMLLGNFGGIDGSHYHHSIRLRPYRQSSYVSGTNQNPGPGGASWPFLGRQQRYHTNSNPTNLPDCPPEGVQQGDEEPEFGNKEFYDKVQVNKFTNCVPPAFPVPPPYPGGHVRPTPRTFVRLDQAPTRGSGPVGQWQGGQGQQPTSGGYYDPYRPATPPPYNPQPWPTSTESYYKPTEGPYRPYPTVAPWPTEPPYRPGLTEWPTRNPYQPPVVTVTSTESYITTKRYAYDGTTTQKPYVTERPYVTEKPYVTQVPSVSQKPGYVLPKVDNRGKGIPPLEGEAEDDYFDRPPKSSGQLGVPLRPLLLFNSAILILGLRLMTTISVL